MSGEVAATGPVQRKRATPPSRSEAGPAQGAIPEQLSTAIEAISGIDLSDVTVHRSSGKPAQIGALAYATGNEIHLAPGAARHLPHEAWHIVQQRQGRVQPTMRVAGRGINDDRVLEHEADAMAARTAAAAMPATPTFRHVPAHASRTHPAPAGMHAMGDVVAPAYTVRTQPNSGGSNAPTGDASPVAGAPASLATAQTFVAPPRQRSANAGSQAVAQRWKSASLQDEMSPEARARRSALLRGNAMAIARQDTDDAEGTDDFADDDELAPYLDTRDQATLRADQGLTELQNQGLAEELHHVVSRDKLNWFYDHIAPAQKDFIQGLFRRQDALGNFRGTSDAHNDGRNALLSLRSNLVPGPEGASRSDDAAHNNAIPTDFDPNFEPSDAGGKLDANSLIYEKIHNSIARAKKDGTAPDTEAIVNHLLDAEQGLAARQGNDSTWENRLPTEQLWEGKNIGRIGQTFWKRHTDRNR
jgi:hypothetical protein